MSKILPKKDFKILLAAYQQHEKKADRAAQLATTKKIIEKHPGVDLNATSEKYSVSLYDSLFYGSNNNFNFPVFAYLLEKGLSPSPRGKTNQSPLATAAAFNSYELCELFLAYGADPNENNHWDGRAVLWHAVQHCHRSVTKLLLNHGANPNTTVNCPQAPEINGMPLWYGFMQNTYLKPTYPNKIISIYDALGMISLLRIHGMDLTIPNPATGEDFAALVHNNSTHPDYKQLQKYVREIKSPVPRHRTLSVVKVQTIS